MQKREIFYWTMNFNLFSSFHIDLQLLTHFSVYYDNLYISLTTHHTEGVFKHGKR